MKRYFVVSDVHGFYTLMREALDKAGFDLNNSDHILISNGDLLDRGNQPLECLRFVNSIPDDRKILVRGNHEDLFEECCLRGEMLRHDYHNGTAETIMDLCEGNCHTISEVFDTAMSNPEWVKYKNSLVDYAEIGKYIFAHGWIPTKIAVSTDPKWEKIPEIYRPTTTVKDPKWRTGNWKSARWSNPFAMWESGFGIGGKTIVCGHWHTSTGHSKYHKVGSEFGEDACFDIFEDKGIIAIDACTAYSKKVNVFVFEN